MGELLHGTMGELLHVFVMSVYVNGIDVFSNIPFCYTVKLYTQPMLLREEWDQCGKQKQNASSLIAFTQI